MLTVYGRATSSNVQPVMWTIAELGLTATRIDRGHVHGGLDTPEFLAMNPHGRIPVLVDSEDGLGGAPIWESTTIIRYLAARYGVGTLWIEDPARRAQMEMWADWAKLDFASRFTVGVFWPVIRTKAGARDEAALAAALEQTYATLAQAEARLAASEWLAGDDFSLADIIFGHILYRYFTIEIARPELPALAAYYARLTARPPYAEHVMVSYDSLRAA
jgi:glutathione S-transferase